MQCVFCYNKCVAIRLKEQQGLLVEFSAFPQKFIDLVNLCSKEEESQNPRFALNDRQSSKYHLPVPSCVSRIYKIGS